MPTATSLSVVMPTVSWDGTFAAAAGRCVEVLEAAGGDVDLTVVFDGDPPAAPAWLDRPGVSIAHTGTKAGPARARNLAAERAAGDIILFVDADVELAGDAIDRIRAAFAADPDLVGVFGAYDDEPDAPGVVSQFRNLLHHHMHATHAGRANTFWSGCGAIRRTQFLDAGGFDENFRFPSVEDIELGMRIAREGGRIVLDPTIRCKHHKTWTLGSMIYTDIVHRARPWTHLIAAERSLPAVLNVDWRGRASGLVAVTAAAALAAVRMPGCGWVAAACLAVLVLLNARFYRLCLKKRGLGLMLAAIPLHWLYFIYATATFGVVFAWEWLTASGRTCACDPPSASAARLAGTNPAGPVRRPALR